MSLQALTTFFMWCTLINTSILMVLTLCFVFGADFVYRTDSKWFPIPRDSYNVVIFSFLGAFKILLLIFSAVPYVSLLILG
jgi:hypothetical protein